MIQVNASDLPTMPVNLSQARVVMYETWTASYHWIKHVDAQKDLVYFGNQFESRWSHASGSVYDYMINTISTTHPASFLKYSYLTELQPFAFIRPLPNLPFTPFFSVITLKI